jgi:spore maturation protein CgeB
LSALTFLGLSLSSSWGNGHATTFRALLKGLAELGHEVRFLERDMPWYRDNRDLPAPEFATLHLYDDLGDLTGPLADLIRDADAVIIGSYVPEGKQAARTACDLARGPVAFYDIDTPVTLARLAEGRCEYLDAAIVPLFDTYFSFTGGPVLQRLEQEFGARRAILLPCGVDPDLYRPLDVPLRWDLGYLGTYSEDRQPALERLLLEPARLRPDLRFVVAGPQYPPDLDWPANVERIEHLPPAEHPSFYSAQRFTLNVTRADMIAAGWAPSVRLFETSACGTPAISDRWPGLEDFFNTGESVLVADKTDDVLAILDMPSSSRDGYSAAARAEVMNAHSGSARARTLLDALAGAR